MKKNSDAIKVNSKDYPSLITEDRDVMNYTTSLFGVSTTKQVGFDPNASLFSTKPNAKNSLQELASTSVGFSNRLATKTQRTAHLPAVTQSSFCISNKPKEDIGPREQPQLSNKKRRMKA